MRRRNSKLFMLLSLFMLAGFGGVITFLAAFSDLEPSDSGALYGGEVESGYPSAGFLLNYTQNGGQKTCGYSVISSQIGITAGHCVDDAKLIYLGKGKFDNNLDNLVKVDKAISKQGWVQNKERVNDFSILSFKATGFYEGYAKLSSPAEGCNYRVVAYGRTENPLEFDKPRKSANLCIDNIGSDTFQVQGYNSGICFGDSGSPIYREGTSELVGIVVSIVKPSSDTSATDVCDFKNRAIAVRVDANQQLILANIQSGNLPSGDTVNDITTISVAEDTLFDRLGLSSLQSLNEAEKQRYLMFGIVGLVIFMIIVILYMLLRPKEQSDSMSLEQYNRMTAQQYLPNQVVT